MAHTVTWTVPGRVIACRLAEQVTIAEIHSIRAEVEAMRPARANAPLHLVVDARAVTRFLTPLTQVIEAVTVLRAPQYGWVLIHGLTDQRVLGNVSVVARLTGARLQLADTHEAALRLLAEVDEALAARL